MKQFQETLEIPTRGRGLVEITGPVRSLVAGAGIDCGLCHVFVQHTSASLVVQENADPSAKRDLESFLERIAPENDPDYTHTAEGPDDMPSHLRSAITKTTETIPVRGGSLALGTWQGLFLCEHRAAPHRRRLLIHVLGE